MTPEDLKKLAARLQPWIRRDQDFVEMLRKVGDEEAAKETEEQIADWTALATLCESLAEPTQEMMDAGKLSLHMYGHPIAALHAMIGAIEVPK